jgi:phosphotransacetylase
MTARTDIAATAMDNGYTDEMIKGMNRQYTDLSAHLNNVIKLEVDVSDLTQADMEAEEFKQSLQEIRA